MSKRREVVYYETPSGNAVVEREIAAARLSKSEATRLERLLEAAEDGELGPKDRSPVAGSIYELRLRGDKRIFRLLCSDLPDGTTILALLFFAKKTQKLPRDKITLAESRLRARN